MNPSGLLIPPLLSPSIWKFTHGQSLSFTNPSSSHRGSGLLFKTLATGTPNTPENFILLLSKQSSFYSPRHRHNFDQFRFSLQGDFSLAPHLILQQGELAYHPEGVYYGPQDDGPEERLMLVLQCGGASGSGFLSHKQMGEANEALKKTGRFEKGRYVADGVGEGESVDGYEAVWSYANGGRKLLYPEGRYHEPVLMSPENFGWRKTEGAQRMERKLLGVFSERETRAEMLRIDGKGDLTIIGAHAIELAFVLRGSGYVGEEHLQEHSTIKLSPGARCLIASEQGIEVLHFVMPML
ncbi:hypothetical protein EV356DRAFT_561776 [Viridothelium virens]|uniref:RmlC-like cupin n=1 Tax=Viridothelium virens TaxID=1048519 RepID=A0A6A6GVV5_VIRVR|nr:hypothetical protein EV356DRAFT_561776 [Viridothelium virens]